MSAAPPARWRLLVLPGLLVGAMLLPFASGAWVAVESRVAWGLDLIAHWQWLYAVGLPVALIPAARRDRRSLALGLAVLLPFVSASPAAPMGPAESGATTVRVVMANVNLENRDPRALLAWAGGRRADVIVLLEVTPGYARDFEEFAREYPHRFVEAEEGPFGLALLSRVPFSTPVITREGTIPRLETKLDLAGREIALEALHPFPPLAPGYAAARDRLLAARGAIAPAYPRIVAGDLNATPWSSGFRALGGRLRRATGLAPTWPARGRGIVGVSLDHVLVSEGWRVLQRENGPAVGSDHLPVFVELALE